MFNLIRLWWSLPEIGPLPACKVTPHHFSSISTNETRFLSSQLRGHISSLHRAGSESQEISNQRQMQIMSVSFITHITHRSTACDAASSVIFTALVASWQQRIKKKFRLAKLGLLSSSHCNNHCVSTRAIRLHTNTTSRVDVNYVNFRNRSSEVSAQDFRKQAPKGS